MIQPRWFVVGGPLHGRWRPAGLEMHCPVPDTAVTYQHRFRRVAVAVPAEPVVYRPTRMHLPGWAVSLPVWAEAHIASGQWAIEFAAVFPGGLHHVPLESTSVCRWCFKPSFGSLGVCLMRECVAAVGWLESLDVPGWQASS